MYYYNRMIKVILQIIVIFCIFWYNITTFNCCFSDQETNEDFLKVSKVSFLDSDDNKHIFHEYAGNILLVYFWASWCLECLNELKTLNKLQEMFFIDEITDIKIIPLSIDFTNTQVIKQIYKQYDITNIPLFIDRNKFAMSFFGINTPPTMFIIDKHNSIVFRFENSINWISPNVYKTLKHIRSLSDSPSIYQTIMNEMMETKEDNMIIKNDSQKTDYLILR